MEGVSARELNVDDLTHINSVQISGHGLNGDDINEVLITIYGRLIDYYHIWKVAPVEAVFLSIHNEVKD